MDNQRKGAPPAMKRIFWTVGVALVGLWFGWFGQGYPFNFAMLAVFAIWGACIGFGFGSVFDKGTSGTRYIICWAVTLAFVGALLFPLVPLRFTAGQVGVAAALGAMAGLLVGSLHVKLAQRESKGQPRVQAGCAKE